jgi:hypothetical protein
MTVPGSHQCALRSWNPALIPCVYGLVKISTRQVMRYQAMLRKSPLFHMVEYMPIGILMGLPSLRMLWYMPIMSMAIEPPEKAGLNSSQRSWILIFRSAIHPWGRSGTHPCIERHRTVCQISWKMFFRKKLDSLDISRQKSCYIYCVAPHGTRHRSIPFRHKNFSIAYSWWVTLLQELPLAWQLRKAGQDYLESSKYFIMARYQVSTSRRLKYLCLLRVNSPLLMHFYKLA